MSRPPWNFGGGPVSYQAASSLVGVTAASRSSRTRLGSSVPLRDAELVEGAGPRAAVGASSLQVGVAGNIVSDVFPSRSMSSRITASYVRTPARRPIHRLHRRRLPHGSRELRRHAVGPLRVVQAESARTAQEPLTGAGRGTSPVALPGQPWGRAAGAMCEPCPHHRGRHDRSNPSPWTPAPGRPASQAPPAHTWSPAARRRQPRAPPVGYSAALAATQLRTLDTCWGQALDSKCGCSINATFLNVGIGGVLV
jgi:hypothetical protein